jgi:hypothetical protein
MEKKFDILCYELGWFNLITLFLLRIIIVYLRIITYQKKMLKNLVGKIIVISLSSKPIKLNQYEKQIFNFILFISL